MSWREMVPVFEVFADDKTGRWLGDPKPTLEQADLDATSDRTVSYGSLLKGKLKSAAHALRGEL